MAVVIGEIVTEVVVAGGGEPEAVNARATGEPDLDAVVRRATERVLEILRREWDT